jgi:hypothetical protein
MSELTARQYRVLYGIRTIDDCQCASEEYAAGFLSEGEQLDLFHDYAEINTITKEFFNGTIEVTEVLK